MLRTVWVFPPPISLHITEHDPLQLIPEGYSILPPAAEQFPGIGEDELPIFIELGREANAGPPLLNFENFQEAKIEVPNVARLNDSSPFLYKRWIAVDNTLDVVGSWICGIPSTICNGTASTN